MSKHTPLPYFIGTEGNINGQDYISISINSQEGERTIALVMGNKKQVEPLANSQFIVKACNNHTDLLEACKELVVSMGNMNPIKGALDAYKQGKQAVAKVEGR